MESRVTVLCALLIFLAGNARALSWSISSVDGPGDVGAYASISLDPLQNPGISYCASSSDDLKFARLVGGSWQIETVDAGGRTGWYTSLAFDAAGDPRIAYWDLTNSALRYARWTGTAWAMETVDNAAYVGQCCSLALDQSGNPSISYYDYTNGDLKFARWDGAAWQIEVIDSGPAQLGAGLYTSLALDAADLPHISYADHSLGQLRYAWWNGVQWTIEAIDGGTPIGTSIQIDAAGIPYISYAYQFGQGSHLKYASRTGAGGTWQTQIVRAGGQVGLYSSLRLRPNGEPSILSWDLGNGAVNYDAYESGGWTHESIEAMAFTDQWCSLALDSSAHLHAAYRSAIEQDLHYAIATNPAGMAEGNPAGHPALSIAPNPVREDCAMRLHLERPSQVRWQVFDILGRASTGPVSRLLPPGLHKIPLPRMPGPGVYFIRMETPSGATSARFVQVR
jgi:hypothetical protein